MGPAIPALEAALVRLDHLPTAKREQGRRVGLASAVAPRLSAEVRVGIDA